MDGGQRGEESPYTWPTPCTGGCTDMPRLALIPSERGGHPGPELSVIVQRNPEQLTHHPLWQTVVLLDSANLTPTASVAYNPFNGCFSRVSFTPPLPVRGGILAGDALSLQT